MRVAATVLLSAYRLAWLLLLPALRIFAAADAALAAIMGRGCIPIRWRVAERLDLGRDRVGRTQAGNPEARERPGRPRGGKTLWLHCASLGEAKGMWALASALRGRCDLLLSATTADGTGYLEERCASARASATDRERVGARSGAIPGIRACLAPLDHPGLVRRFLERHGVRGLCLYEAEIWPHYLAACRESGLPAALVSARLSPGAFRTYRIFPGAASALLEGVAFIDAQSPEDAARFSRLLATRSGPDRRVRVGDDYKAAHFLGSLPGTRPGCADGTDARVRRRFAFLSLHPAELAWFRNSLPDLMRRFDVVVFPRHLSRMESFQAILEPMGFALHSRDPRARHLLVDSLGKIGPMLRECHSAFVGGSLVAAGCHNLWEPLLGGLKTYFGPNHGNQEPLAGQMLRRGLAEVVLHPAQVGSWRVPESGIRAAAAILAQQARREVDSALRECAGAIFATFYGTGGGAAGILEKTSDLPKQG